ncbi:MAG: sulfotransferase [Desulfobacteraceae bacterium]|nr:sulfotransferase [Desulfobacteraceae bacterium]
MKSLIKSAIQWPVPGMAAIGRCFSRRLYECPAFVVGVGRSGTSILVRSLGEHRQILSAAREVPVFTYVAHVGYQLTSGPRAEHFRYCCRISLKEMLRRLRRLLFEICWGPNYGVCNFLHSWATAPLQMAGKKCWVVRTFPDAEAAEGLQRLFPKVKFIYIHRNGIEVVSSRMKYEAFRHDRFETHCEVWANSAEKFRYLTEVGCAITVSHEELVAKRQETFDAIIDFLDLDQDEGPARFAESTMVIPRDIPRERQRLSDVDVTKIFEERPPSYLEWNGKQKRQFKEICGNAMQQLGYEMPF